jgi:Cof subfamily protein (haloacid dehalogenase superfamily)
MTRRTASVPIRLVALDIDGTLLPPDGHLPSVVRDAVAAVRATGVQVVLATGRSPWHGVAPLAQALGLRGPQLTMQGALVMDPVTGRVERSCPLDPGTYLDALAAAAELDIDPVVATPFGHRAARLMSGIDFVQQGPGVAHFRVTPQLRDLAMHHPMRVYLPTGPERHDAVRRTLARRFLGRAAVVWTDLEGVELMAHGVNKGAAIEWLASRQGIPLEAVAAVGDAWNDVEMLRVAGRSAAMATAPEPVKAAAQVIVPPAAEGGVVDALAWFLPDRIAVHDRAPAPALADAGA